MLAKELALLAGGDGAELDVDDARTGAGGQRDDPGQLTELVDGAQPRVEGRAAVARALSNAVDDDDA